MTALFCNQCGEPARPAATRCAACGKALEQRGDDPTGGVPARSWKAPDGLSESQLQALAATRSADAGVLVVVRGHNLGGGFELQADVTRVGREPTAHVFLDDVSVSRRHAEIRSRAAEYLLADLGSLNGTYLNGTRVEEAVLHEGDQLQVGKFKLVFFAAASRV